MTNLQGDVGLRADFGGGQLHVGVLAHEVDGDELLAALSREAGEAAAHGLSLCHDALGAVLALVVVTGAGLQQYHGRRSLTEQATAQAERRHTASVTTAFSFSFQVLLMPCSGYLKQRLDEIKRIKAEGLQYINTCFYSLSFVYPLF